jgi:hypothetical protein
MADHRFAAAMRCVTRKMITPKGRASSKRQGPSHPSLMNPEDSRKPTLDAPVVPMKVNCPIPRRMNNAQRIFYIVRILARMQRTRA